MHRHGYKGRKFGRETDQRRALMRGLMRALVVSREIETTEAKAKELRRPMEKLITLARKGGLANRRLVIARMNDIEVANMLIEEIAPKLKRDSGYLRIERTRLRVGDNAQMARISFVDDVKVVEAEIVKKANSSEKPGEKKAAKKPVEKKETK
ncbi:50S ribosomal protein L17 [Candidatus Saccharibacteria bacterium]|nr:50S ribosomal protein L17 [Candidatus Saccharibacteria bacterium]